ncbi:sulfotransferase 6B1-like isoform X2 [Sander vitreus]
MNSNASVSKMQMAKDMKEEDKLYRYNGVLYPRLMCPEENLQALQNIEAREDDVMLVAYPKCATRRLPTFRQVAHVTSTSSSSVGGCSVTLSHHRERASNVLHWSPSRDMGPGGPFLYTLWCFPSIQLRFNWMVGVMRKVIAEAKGVKTESKMPPLIEFMGPDVVKVLDETPSPRLLGTHLHHDNIPKSFGAKKTKMLVIFRNPKDTLVSFYHFTNNNPVLPSMQSWESFYSTFLSGDVPWGSYFDHALAWEKRMDDPNVMIVTYEELKQDLSEGVRQISTFFGFSLTEAQVQQIAERSTFTAMKEDNSLGTMGNVIFRKGEVGDWKNHFTPEQSREMDEAFNKHLAGTRLGDKLNYQLYCGDDR